MLLLLLFGVLHMPLPGRYAQRRAADICVTCGGREVWGGEGLQRGGERKCRQSREPQMCCFKCGSSLFDSRQRLQSAGGTSARSFSVLISSALVSLFPSFCLFSLSFAPNPVKIFFKSSHWLAEGLSLWAAAEPVSACERRM